MSVIIDAYNYLNYNLTDPRTIHLPTMESPLSLVAFIGFFNYFVLSLGPRLMKDKEPFNLKGIMIVYNAIQVVANTVFFYKAWVLGWGWGARYNLFCNEIEYDDTPYHREVAFICYLYYLLKISDLADTIFFVLRKKSTHVSFLHLYHHSGMVIVGYLNAKYVGVGHHTFIGFLNTAVHMFMYSYYLITLILPQKKTEPWKKFITQLQMLQFMLIAASMGGIFFQPNCNYPRWICLGLVPQNLFMMILFYDFYRRAYVCKKKKE